MLDLALLYRRQGFTSAFAEALAEATALDPSNRQAAALATGYFRQNVDTRLEDLELYDSQTEEVLHKNLALNEMTDDMQIAEAVSTALSSRIDNLEEEDEEVVLDEIKNATIEDLEKMKID